MVQLDDFFVSHIFMTPVRLSKCTLMNQVGDGHPISWELTVSSSTGVETNHQALDEDDVLHVGAMLGRNKNC